MLSSSPSKPVILIIPNSQLYKSAERIWNRVQIRREDLESQMEFCGSEFNSTKKKKTQEYGHDPPLTGSEPKFY